MNQKTPPQIQKTLGIGCVTVIAFTFLGAIIAPLIFIVSMVSSPAYQNAAPGKEALLVFGPLPFVLVGAVGGALLGVLASGIIALVLWLRNRKTPQTE
ncbi:MAG TPA: hypothetical protein G4N96_09375 [Chloroflexi bacterium]|nr:hypothetical protein [Chloroflexota bacterium]